MEQHTDRRREYCLDGIKFIACMIIFWTHFVGAFYSLCAVNPGLSPRMERLLTGSPLKILTDSAMMLMIFMMISGYLAAGKRIRTFRELWQSAVFRYLRFAVPFLLVNLLVSALWYSVGFRTQEAAELLHNDWVRGFYVIPVTPALAVREAVTLGSLANGPLWMMRHLAGATCAVYVYTYLRERISSVRGNTDRPEGGKSPAFRGTWALPAADLAVLAAVSAFCSFAEKHLLWNGMYLVQACFLGVFLRHLPEPSEALRERFRAGFTALAVLGIALEAQGYVTILKLVFQAVGAEVPAWLRWNAWYCMGFSFLFLWAVRYSGWPKRLLETKAMRRISAISFSVFLVHWPVTAAFSFRLLLRMVNTMSYNRVFVFILAVTTLAVCVAGWLYEMSCGRLADRVSQALQKMVRRRWPVS